jgi:carbonic anhydrase
MDDRAIEDVRKRNIDHRGHSHFERPPMEAPRLLELREKHRSGALSQTESLEFLLAGNQEHVTKLKESGVSPLERHERIITGQADYMIIACSDARLPRIDSEDDKLVGVQIRIAGNVVPEKGSISQIMMGDSVRMVRPDGAVIIEGHVHCGAVKAKMDLILSGKTGTGNEQIDTLLRQVIGTDPLDNAIMQLEKARKLLELGSRKAGAMIYNWESGGLSIVGTSNAPEIELLNSSINQRHLSAAHPEKGLAQMLKSHKPHAIMVGTRDLPFGVSTITHSEQNELFSTTGSERGLDTLGQASILYAIEHLGVKHIAFMAPGQAEDEKKIRTMFNRWEKELRNLKVEDSPLIERMLEKGEIGISMLRYDLATGKLQEMAGPN